MVLRSAGVPAPPFDTVSNRNTVQGSQWGKLMLWLVVVICGSGGGVSTLLLLL